MTNKPIDKKDLNQVAKALVDKVTGQQNSQSQKSQATQPKPKN